MMGSEPSSDSGVVAHPRSIRVSSWNSSIVSRHIMVQIRGVHVNDLMVLRLEILKCRNHVVVQENGAAKDTQKFISMRKHRSCPREQPHFEFVCFLALL